MPPIAFCFDDGGRRAAGFKGPARDCVTRAIAIATSIPYRTVYRALNTMASRERPRGRRRRSSARFGVARATYSAYLRSLGWIFRPTMGIGTGCRVHLRANELPAGRLIVELSGHMAAVVDGVLYDTRDCSRGGTRCVYGYFMEPSA